MSSNKPWKFILALVASFATLATHFYLSKHYFELQLGVSSGSAVCNINSTFNCDTVSASKYASLIGIPIALWGLTIQLILFLFTLNYTLGFSSDRARMGRYTLYLSFLVAGASVVMGSLSLFFLSSYCLFCILAYILSFIHLFAVLSTVERNFFSSLSEDIYYAFTKSKGIGLSVISVIPLVFLFNNMFLDHFGGSLLKETIENSVSVWSSDTIPKKNFTTNGLTKGPSNAKMVIIEFADFLCPHCKHAAPSLKVFTDSHPDVQLIFKAFPLDGSCNADSKIPKGDGLRCTLAKSVFCAEKVAKKGWEIYEKIFELQEQIYTSGKSTDILNSLFQGANLNLEEMDQCRGSEETHQNILAQSQEGMQAQIEGTPSIFVNNKFLSRGHLIPVLQRVYDSL